MRLLKACGSAALIWLVLDTLAQPRILPSWSVHELLKAATLAVVARPTDVKVITAKKLLPDVPSGYPNIYVDDVETTFEALAVVKGTYYDGTFVLHHLRYTDNRGPVMVGPGLVTFDPRSGKRYLMFLKEDADGRYVAVSGLLESASAIIGID